jgi:transposase
VKKQKQRANHSAWQVQPLGRPKIITEEYVAFSQQLVNRSPKEYGYPFQRWTAAWLRCHLAKELGIEVSDRHVNRLLHQMGLSTWQGPPAISGNRSTVQARRISIKDLDPEKVPKFDWPFN